MKLFRPLLFLCLASAVALAAVVAVDVFNSPLPLANATSADMLTAAVFTYVMKTVVGALALLVVALLAVAIVASARRWWIAARVDRSLVYYDPWRLSEPYQRPPG
ncbi:hypothetical protein NKI72_26760 [Mesorhizobium sp. M0437]|uniref:hypothetical protein n=1 Tax=Mesorhizobium sp. M0437 TaxID=2956945 RepID=UPI00333AF4F1